MAGEKQPFPLEISGTPENIRRNHLSGGQIVSGLTMPEPMDMRSPQRLETVPGMGGVSGLGTEFESNYQDAELNRQLVQEVHQHLRKDLLQQSPRRRDSLQRSPHRRDSLEQLQHSPLLRDSLQRSPHRRDSLEQPHQSPLLRDSLQRSPHRRDSLDRLQHSPLLRDSLEQPQQSPRLRDSLQQQQQQRRLSAELQQQRRLSAELQQPPRRSSAEQQQPQQRRESVEQPQQRRDSVEQPQQRRESVEQPQQRRESVEPIQEEQNIEEEIQQPPQQQQQQQPPQEEGPFQPPPPFNQEQRRLPTTAFICRLGQDCVDDIYSKVFEVFRYLKNFPLPAGTAQSTRFAYERKLQLEDRLRVIKFKFKQLRRIFDKCNENCQSQGMEYVDVESLVPMKDGSESKFEKKKMSDIDNVAFEERVRIIQQIVLKNRQIKDIIFHLRRVVFEVNVMLEMRRTV